MRTGQEPDHGAWTIAAPGVGKTYAMLQEGQRFAEVVVGFVEPHGRRPTAALLEGLEVVARRTMEYRLVPALLAAGLLADYYFTAPVHSLRVERPADLLHWWCTSAPPPARPRAARTRPSGRAPRPGH